MRRARGFTLVELLVTVTVLALLAAVAVPSFQNLIRENQLTATANDLVASLLMARSEAVRRESEARVSANGGDWSTGWIVEAENPTTLQFNTISSFSPSSSDFVITAVGATADAPIRFNSNGRSIASYTSNVDYIKLTMGDDHVRYLCLSATGRPYAKKEECQ